MYILVAYISLIFQNYAHTQSNDNYNSLDSIQKTAYFLYGRGIMLLNFFRQIFANVTLLQLYKQLYLLFVLLLLKLVLVVLTTYHPYIFNKREKYNFSLLFLIIRKILTQKGRSSKLSLLSFCEF